MSAPFHDHRAAAMAIITSGATLRPNEGQFLGGLAFGLNPPTPKQIDWLIGLLDRHGLPTLEGEVAR
jgi:hypothetical protein